MRLTTRMVLLALAASPLFAQEKPAMRTKSAAIVAQTPQTAVDPCASKKTALSPRIAAAVNFKELAALPTVKPMPQPEIVTQELDPIRAVDAVWEEAIEEVTALIEAKHPLSDDDKSAIQKYDDAHPKLRDRFLFRTEALKQVIAQ